MDIDAVYRYMDTPTLVRLFSTEVNAAEILPAPEGKHLATAVRRRDDATIDADITVKTTTGADVITAAIPQDEWDALERLPDDFMGNDDEERWP